MADEVFEKLIDKRGAPTDSAWSIVAFADILPGDIIRKKCEPRVTWRVDSLNQPTLNVTEVNL